MAQPYRDAARQLAGRSLVVGLSALSTAGSYIHKAAQAGAGAIAASGSGKEPVRWVAFDSLAPAGEGGAPLPVLLLAYDTGFQVWSLEDPAEPRELASRRDGPVRFLRALPEPLRPVPPLSPRAGAGPLLAVAHAEPEGEVALYSLRLHSQVHRVQLRRPIVGLAASRRVIVIAVPGQVVALDATTLAPRFSALTHSPDPGLGDGAAGLGAPDSRRPSARPAGAYPAAPLALGARWLAYADAQPAAPDEDPTAARRVRGRRGAGGGAPDARADAARRPGDSIAAAARLAADKGRVGLETAGGFVADRYASWRSARRAAAVAAVASRGPHAGATDVPPTAPSTPDASPRAIGPLGATVSTTAVAGPGSPGIATPDDPARGTVAVRDVVTRAVVVSFRAHEGPVACLAWSARGDRLATAAAAGRGVNVYTIVPSAGGAPARAEHVFRLVRGLTPTRIQHIVLDDHRAVVVSGAGTAHAFDLGAKGGTNGARRSPASVTAGPPGSAATATAAAAAAAAAASRRPGVVGEPRTLHAHARARRPGALPGGVGSLARGANDALRGSGTPSARVPAAAALTAPLAGAASAARSSAAGGADPASARGVSAAAAASAGGASGQAPSRMLLAANGFLAAHELRVPAAPDAGEAPQHPVPASDGSDDGLPAPTVRAPPPLAETDRWDIRRHPERPERDAVLPQAARKPPRASPRAARELGPAPLHVQQAWLAHAPAARVRADPPFASLDQFRFTRVGDPAS